jgi:hypothetical protein
VFAYVLESIIFKPLQLHLVCPAEPDGEPASEQDEELSWGWPWGKERWRVRREERSSEQDKERSPERHYVHLSEEDEKLLSERNEKKRDWADWIEAKEKALFSKKERHSEWEPFCLALCRTGMNPIEFRRIGKAVITDPKWLKKYV